MPSSTYTKQWRARVRPGVVASADALVPLLAKMFSPKTVLDVGCGEGHFCRAWGRAGAENVQGIDGPWVLEGETAPGDWHFHPVDLGQPGVLAASIASNDACVASNVHWDLVTSFEVAEHLPEARAASFVADLCALAGPGVILFSAAVPGQGGEGHVNERWPGYWRDLFADHGYAGSGRLRWLIWDDDRISPWYRQNLLVFGRDTPADGCPSVIHPGLWEWKGHR